MTWARAIVGSFLSWVAILATLALYGTIWLVASALRLIVGTKWTAHSPRAGLGAVTAAGRDGPAATPCRAGFRTPGRATPSAGLLPTTVPPYVGRSAQLRVLDLFSGIGGFSLGLERTGGFKTVHFCEIDPFCRRVLAKHWPNVPCHDDVTTMQFHEGMADVVTGGFPCQDISFAGNGAGLAGERSGLYRHLVDAIRLVRPRYAILENVAALLSRGLGDVLGDLAAIGYDAECHCIPASAVGAPHVRDRVWILGNPKRQSRPPHAEGIQVERFAMASARAVWPRPDEPPFCGVAYGVQYGTHRNRSLGNSIVPQIAEMIGQAILTAERQQARAA